MWAETEFCLVTSVTIGENNEFLFKNEWQVLSMSMKFYLPVTLCKFAPH